jgi:hypothetical protein
MEEEFRIIKDYENYSVSNYGNVRNNTTGKILKRSINSNGYYGVKLCKDGKAINFKIHRLIANAFIPNPDDKPCVDHIDNNKVNNNLVNLRWCSISENNFNMSLSSKNKSGFKGVRFDKMANRWISEIGFFGKTIFIGYFNNIEDAIQARKLKANELFGSFTNHIEKIKSELELLEEEFQNLINNILSFSSFFLLSSNSSSFSSKSTFR